ncbi:MAG: hypothetical protein ABUS48_07310 [Pseudomonadota bacterium]
MEEVVKGCDALSGLSLVRARAAESYARKAPAAFDAKAAWARFDELMA